MAKRETAMDPATEKLLRTDKTVRKRLAKFMAQQCFRNTGLEDLHAGKGPSSKAGDYSDVKVVTPYGEIPWQELSRFNDDEMKALMIEVVQRCYTFIGLLCDSKKARVVVESLKEADMVPYWQDPE
jgi:hypothetical protein